MRLPESRAARAGLAVLALVVAINVVGAVIDAVAPSPSGPASSSFATKSKGLAAWAALAEREGLRVRALRKAPSSESLSGGGTVAVMDAGRLTSDEARALRAFAERGGRVVAGGRPGDWTRTLLDGDPPKWEDSGPDIARTLAAAPESEGVRRVRTAGDGRWARPGPDQRVLAGDEGTLLLVTSAGRGRMALLADTSPLQNRLLGDADNAALALALSGRGPLTFVESVHGYGPARGLAALPARFGWALIGLALAALVFMAARGRRLGPPEPERRDLPPPRRAYVDALAATMARGKAREEAVAPVRAEARRRLARRAGLGPQADADAWRAAALAAGLEETEARALSGRAEDDETVLATGRALAALAGPAERRDDAGAP
ncbi:MAG: hypothetical protein QOD44_4083 [Solirubrobacteraceae bacterium]|jgi:hypothetical protein|nr:hypothetical protein [Solirubrobacteraceae bacterium]